jgi:hypothetical protein
MLMELICSVQSIEGGYQRQEAPTTENKTVVIRAQLIREFEERSCVSWVGGGRGIRLVYATTCLPSVAGNCEKRSNEAPREVWSGILGKADRPSAGKECQFAAGNGLTIPMVICVQQHTLR